MLLFLHDARSKQSHGSSTGPEGIANVGHPFSAENLERAVCFNNEKGTVKKQQTFHFVHFVQHSMNSDYDYE